MSAMTKVDLIDAKGSWHESCRKEGTLGGRAEERLSGCSDPNFLQHSSSSLAVLQQFFQASHLERLDLRIAKRRPKGEKI